jgi:hypothetical protein
MQIRTNDPFVFWVKTSSCTLSLSFFLLWRLLLSFLLLLLFGVCVLFLFANFHTKLTRLWGETITSLSAVMRCSRHQLSAMYIARATAHNNHYWMKVYLDLIWTFIVSKILPHFISEVEKRIFCFSACLPKIKLWNVWFVEMLDEW